VLQAADRIKEAGDLLRAQYDGQPLRLAAGRYDVIEVPSPLESDLVQEAEGGDGDPDRTGRKLPIPAQVQLEWSYAGIWVTR
jgi:hypothetical protein